MDEAPVGEGKLRPGPRSAPRARADGDSKGQPLTKEVLLSLTTTQAKVKGETPEHFLQRLTHLQLQAQRLGPSLQRLDMVTGATVVFAYDNLISSLSGFEHLRKLQLLYLQNNKLATLAGIETLVNLKTLHVSHNRLTRIEGLEGMRQLEELHCAHQNERPGIPQTSLQFCEESMAAIGGTLQVLDASNNSMEDVASLQHLGNLRTLDLSNNFIPSVNHIGYMLQSEALTKVTLANNPLTTQDRNYRSKIVLVAPAVEEIDGKGVLPTERDFVMRLAEQKRRAEVQRRAQMMRQMDGQGPMPTEA